MMRAATAMLLVLLAMPTAPAAEPAADDVAERSAKAGETIPADVAARFPLREQSIKSDTGINVLVDLAHQALFFTMWNLPGVLRQNGLRAVGSQAALDTVLAPEGKCRVRVPAGGIQPFAWVPGPAFNVVLTIQEDPHAQAYLPEEIAALRKFVEGGGGLVLVGGTVRGREAIDRWPLANLAAAFGARFTDTRVEAGGAKAPALDLDAAWKAVTEGEGGRPVHARRALGKGRVAILSSIDMIRWKDKAPAEAPDSRESRGRFLAEVVRWAAGGKPPVGGPARLPVEQAGGGPIYPELEERIGNVVVYYARNQKPELIKAVTDDMPAVQRQVEAWLASTPSGEAAYLILSAGGGGGWAVNAYRPHEVGIIALDKEGVLSVFAHELAHNTPGPTNDRGQRAGRLPDVFSEAHAGWFQGKIEAQRLGKRDGHDPNNLFQFDKDGTSLDLVNLPRGDMGKGWTKLWWVWQKLDERYGPTWYPRWCWVKNTRWAQEPGRRLTWDDVVEDMSIAVGEDLVPFFRKIGTTLTKERLAEVTFQGRTLALPEAPLALGKAGEARLGKVGDYKAALPRGQ